MQKSSLGEIEIHTEVCYWIMSGTEEIRSWITCLGSTQLCLLKNSWTSSALSAQTPSEDRVQKHFGFPLVHLVIFQEHQCLGVLRVWVQVTQIGSNGMWPLMSKGPQSQKGPHFCSPFHEVPDISWTTGPTLLCPTLSFFTGSYKSGSWSWAPSEMLMRKKRYPPSFSFLPDQNHNKS